MDNDDDTPSTLLSRSGSSNIFGKCTEEVKTLVPFEIKEAFSRAAHEHGVSPSEFLRELVMINILGVDGVRKIYETRLSRIAGIRPE